MAGEKGTVLVIDDDASVRDVLGRFLARAGYQVRVAADGKQGLLAMHMPTPDVIVLDLMMPVMSGFDVLNALRANPEWSKVPVVVLTASTEHTAASLQVDQLLSKPFESMTVVKAVDAVVAAKPADSG